jgi:hypothetical protein
MQARRGFARQAPRRDGTRGNAMLHRNEGACATP